MNVNTGKITLKFARNDGTEHWSGSFVLASGKMMPLMAQVDEHGYHVTMKSQDFRTELARFTIPNFGERSLQNVLSDKGRTIRCARDVNRIDLSVLAR